MVFQRWSRWGEGFRQAERQMMASRCWSYPVLLASIGEGQRPNRAELRVLVRRLRREAFPEICEPARRRQRVRLAVTIILAD